MKHSVKDVLVKNHIKTEFWNLNSLVSLGQGSATFMLKESSFLLTATKSHFTVYKWHFIAVFVAINYNIYFLNIYNNFSAIFSLYNKYNIFLIWQQFLSK